MAGYSEPTLTDDDLRALIQRRADINRLASERPLQPRWVRVTRWCLRALAYLAALAMVCWLSTFGCAQVPVPAPQRVFPDTLLAGVTFTCYSYPVWAGVTPNLAHRLYCPLLDPDVKGSAPDGPHPAGFDARWTCQVEPTGDSVLCEPEPDSIRGGRTVVGV